MKKAADRKSSKPRCNKITREFRRDWQLHLLMLLPVIYLIVFSYIPMYGAQIAFRDYRVKEGIFGSAWVGMKWFEKFVFNNIYFERIITNTVVLSLYDILVGFPLPIVFALLINCMGNEKVKKYLQTIIYVPHFISIVVLISIVNQVLNPVNGLYGNFYHLLGNPGYPNDIRSLASSFRHIYVWSGVWQNLGWNTIIYTAALSSVSQENHEAAQVDGANRFQRILHVDFPSILPTVCIMLILRCGSLMSVGFEKTFLLQSDLNLAKSEVISTYVYKVGLGSSRDFSYGAAIGLFNSVINCALLLLVNYITRKLSKDEIGMF